MNSTKLRGRASSASNQVSKTTYFFVAKAVALLRLVVASLVLKATGGVGVETLADRSMYRRSRFELPNNSVAFCVLFRRMVGFSLSPSRMIRSRIEDRRRASIRGCLISSTNRGSVRINHKKLRLVCASKDGKVKASNNWSRANPSVVKLYWNCINLKTPTPSRGCAVEERRKQSSNEGRC